MESKFEVLFLEEARQFLKGLDEKTRTKVIYNIDKARILNDPKLFKKLTNEIWEFLTKYNGLQYRLLAFWDKTIKTKTLVISTHGFVKKVDKVSASEIEKANEMRKLYFKQKKRMKMKEKKLKTYSLDNIKDEMIGKRGTEKRDSYEFELNLELLGEMIRATRQQRRLTQEQLGELIGVRKAQISKLEKNANNVTVETILKVFNALKAKVNLKIQLQEKRVNISVSRLRPPTKHISHADRVDD